MPLGMPARPPARAQQPASPARRCSGLGQTPTVPLLAVRQAPHCMSRHPARILCHVHLHCGCGGLACDPASHNSRASPAAYSQCWFMNHSPAGKSCQLQPGRQVWCAVRCERCFLVPGRHPAAAGMMPDRRDPLGFPIFYTSWPTINCAKWPPLVAAVSRYVCETASVSMWRHTQGHSAVRPMRGRGIGLWSTGGGGQRCERLRCPCSRLAAPPAARPPARLLASLYAACRAARRAYLRTPRQRMRSPPAPSRLCGGSSRGARAAAAPRMPAGTEMRQACLHVTQRRPGTKHKLVREHPELCSSSSGSSRPHEWPRWQEVGMQDTHLRTHQLMHTYMHVYSTHCAHTCLLAFNDTTCSF